MTLLYVTSDKIGISTGGGLVTQHESEALGQMLSLSWVKRTLDRTVFDAYYEAGGDRSAGVWSDDEYAATWKDWFVLQPKLAHFYSSTFPKTVANLKRNGCKVAYTIAAHDRELSLKAHLELGLGFPYPHLTEEPLWQRYIDGYRNADVIVCPSTVSAETVRRYGPDFENKRIEVIPHGCVLPERVAPLPTHFTVGYMGSFGADKGVRYLLEAWKRLAYRDATLVLAGKDSTGDGAVAMLRYFGGGNVILKGWVDDVSDFYNSISVYVQPSVTEGYGIEVLEACAHGRPVIVSDGAGAADVVSRDGKYSGAGFRFGIGDVECLAAQIDGYRKNDLSPKNDGENARKYAEGLTWDGVRQQYKTLWSELLK